MPGDREDAVPRGMQMGVTPLGVPIFSGGFDLEDVIAPAKLRPAPDDDAWLEWWHAVRPGLLGS